MKKLVKLASVLAALALLFGATSCSDSDDDDGSGPETTVAATAVTIAATGYTEGSFAVGSSATLTATVTPTNSTDTVTWTSSDTSIATVSPTTGATTTVTAVAAGTAIITATAGSVSSDPITITVTAASGEEDPDSGEKEDATLSAVIKYDGSAEANVPTLSGDEGLFSSVSDAISDYGVLTGYEATMAYKSEQTFTGDDKTTTVSASGMQILSDLIDGKTTVSVTASDTVAYATYNFTLDSAASVTAAVEACNTQTGNLKGRLEILDSSKSVVYTKDAESGSKTSNAVTGEAVSLDAGTYTLKFSWIPTKETTVKKVNSIVTGFTISAESK